MIFLISPAKKLECLGENSRYPVTRPRFLEEAEYLAKKLKKKSARSLSNMMDLSDDLAELNHLRYSIWSSSPTSEASSQTLFLFQGDVYQGLGASDFKKKEIKYAQKHLRILSGLYGLLRPMDTIMPYRLEMGSDFKVTATKKNLYAYWADRISEAIKEDAVALGTDIVVNLASNEYSRAAKLKKTGLRVIEPEFKDMHKGEYKIISFFAKKARGLMTRYAIQNSINDVEDLKGFDLEGYHFDQKLSKGDKWVFTRE